MSHRYASRSDSMRTQGGPEAVSFPMGFACTRPRSRPNPAGRKAMANQVVWVDIPVLKLDRAIRFYSAVIGTQVQKLEYPGGAIGTIPHKDNESGGCLYVSEEVKPSADGPLVYLNVHGRIDEAVEAVEPSGGKILKAKESMGPFGFRAIILDTEGNRIALHSM